MRSNYGEFATIQHKGINRGMSTKCGRSEGDGDEF